MYKELSQAWEELTAEGSQFELEEVNVRGIDLLCYKNQPATLRDFWLSSLRFGNADYLVYGDERISYEEAHGHVASIANWFIENDVQVGDRVAIAMRNYPEWMLAYWACMSIGATCVGMNAWWATPELEYALNDSKPKVVIADKERLEQLIDLHDSDAFPQLVGVRAETESAHVIEWDVLIEKGGAVSYTHLTLPTTMWV